MSVTASPSVPVQNRILAGMAPELFDCVRPHLQHVALRRRAILQEHNHLIQHVYFIERGVASLFARTQRDGPVEVAIIGRLGFVGVGAVLGTMHSPNRCVMEVPGEALRIASKDLSRVMEEVPLLRLHLLTYVHALLIQNTQTALCNIRHELEERLCRWLLLASDRLDEKVIPLTHDQLAIILGVRRAGIATTLSNLENRGALTKKTGTVEINDRSQLETRTCECYRIVASAYKQMMDCGSYHHAVCSHSIPL
jgi:CRP-like cAMP-binding protein